MNKIPRIIHYCWFGGKELPDNVKKCISSWSKFCPEYKIIRWDETNYDINKCEFIKRAYEGKKWAFVSDYARLDVVFRYGGIYLDTDVELLKSLDGILNEVETGFWAFENDRFVQSGLGFAACKENEIIREMMDQYHDVEFDAGKLFQFACPIINTRVLVAHGLLQNNQMQNVEGFTIYPTEYFCPTHPRIDRDNFTENTVAIHHYSASWVSTRKKIVWKVIIFIKKILPSKQVEILRKIIRNYKRKRSV